jgi:hypothetical protein
MATDEHAYASVIKDKKMPNSVSMKKDKDNVAHGFPILFASGIAKLRQSNMAIPHNSLE